MGRQAVENLARRDNTQAILTNTSNTNQNNPQNTPAGRRNRDGLQPNSDGLQPKLRTTESKDIKGHAHEFGVLFQADLGAYKAFFV